MYVVPFAGQPLIEVGIVVGGDVDVEVDEAECVVFPEVKPGSKTKDSMYELPPEQLPSEFLKVNAMQLWLGCIEQLWAQAW